MGRSFRSPHFPVGKSCFVPFATFTHNPCSSLTFATTPHIGSHIFYRTFYVLLLPFMFAYAVGVPFAIRRPSGGGFCLYIARALATYRFLCCCACCHAVYATSAGFCLWPLFCHLHSLPVLQPAAAPVYHIHTHRKDFAGGVSFRRAVPVPCLPVSAFCCARYRIACAMRAYSFLPPQAFRIALSFAALVPAICSTITYRLPLYC